MRDKATTADIQLCLWGTTTEGRVRTRSQRAVPKERDARGRRAAGLTFEDHGKRCHDCRARVSLLPSRRYPQAWSELTIVREGREITIFFCAPCGTRRLNSADDAIESAA